MIKFLKFAFKFITIFLFFYLGTKLVIALAAPDGKYYSSFIDNYFDYVSWLKLSYMRAAAVIASAYGYVTNELPGFLLKVKGGRGVYIAYDCVGYGVMSFWLAYVLSSDSVLKIKLIWTIIGLFLIWFINVIRIGFFLVSINKGWDMPLNIDHHTWFTIMAYVAIFILMWIKEKKDNLSLKRKNKHE